MIINASGHNFDGRLFFTLPNIVLDRRMKYKIGVNRIYLTISKPVPKSVLNNELFFVRSNLVDRSAENPHQSIVYFNYKRKDNSVQSYNAPSVIYQPLQLYELDNASFEICRLNGKELSIDLLEIFLQIEIRRIDSYAWI